VHPSDNITSFEAFPDDTEAEVAQEWDQCLLQEVSEPEVDDGSDAEWDNTELDDASDEDVSGEDTSGEDTDSKDEKQVPISN
jgi:hypothetical protein